MPGSVEYDEAKKTYTVAGGGENMWATTDAFHLRLEADVGRSFDRGGHPILGTGGNAHRKACLIIRQSLEPIRRMPTPRCTATA